MPTALEIETDEPDVETEPIWTVADLVAKLGDVPPERILMTPAPGMATEADVIRLAERADKRLCELVDGILVEKAMSVHSTFLAAWLVHVLMDFVVRHDLGFVNGADALSRMATANVRIPDVSFYSWEQCGGRRIPDVALMTVSPALAVEVLSPSNTGREMRQKREEYFPSGSRLVWEFDPRTRTVRVFTGVQTSELLTEADQLTGGAVLPGFAVSLRDVFGKLNPQG